MFFKAIYLAIFFFLATSLPAQNPPPPPPGGGHGLQGNQPPGGGAPIGSGIFLLLGLGLAYGTKKAYQSNQNGDLG